MVWSGRVSHGGGGSGNDGRGIVARRSEDAGAIKWGSRKVLPCEQGTQGAQGFPNSALLLGLARAASKCLH